MERKEGTILSKNLPHTHQTNFLLMTVSLVCLLSRYVHYGSGPKRFPIQDVLQCALEFAEHGPVTSQPVTDVLPADTSTTAGENTMYLSANFAQASGIMDVDMESPHSLSRLINIELLP